MWSAYLLTYGVPIRVCSAELTYGSAPLKVSALRRKALDGGVDEVQRAAMPAFPPVRPISIAVLFAPIS